MSDFLSLKTITEERLKTVDILINAADWAMAAYMMGYVLECALKATTCKALNLDRYPENTSDKNKDSYFMTHRFYLLLTVSGMEDVFSARGPADAWKNWGDFIEKYEGDWTASIRYGDSKKWDEITVRTLYSILTDPDSGILTQIRKRW